jgi:7,8-dihydropterin-6-yl-methyl-4-(beta-D-ribofuranosyl)aminobenzene 5'-phosphate synthase
VGHAATFRAIDPAALDALVSSHGHYGHFGGISGFRLQNNGKLKTEPPIYVGGEEAFCSREWTAPPVGGISEPWIAERGHVAVAHRDEDWRRPRHWMLCRQASEEERTKAVIPDQFRHEIAIAANLRGRRLIILTSCTIKQAQAVSCVNKVHAVIGGIHLAPGLCTTRRCRGADRSNGRTPMRLSWRL